MKKVVVVDAGDVGPVVKSQGYEVKRLITTRRAGSSKILLGVATIDPNAAEPPWQKDQEEAYYILKGEISLFYNDTKVVIKKGQAAFLPAGLKYREINEGKEQCVYVYVVSPPFE